MDRPMLIGYMGQRPVYEAKHWKAALVIVQGEEAKLVGSRFSTCLYRMLSIEGEAEYELNRLPEALAKSPSQDVLLIPWSLHEEADGFLDRVQCLLPEPVTERPVQRGRVPLPRGVPTFGPWGQPLNAREQLDRWVRVYPGWHSTATVFETDAGNERPSRRIAVLWSRPSVTPPVDVKQWSETVSDARFLLAAALYPDIQATARERRDGTLYLSYLCNIIQTLCRHLG